MGTPQAIASLHLLIQRLAHAEAEGGSVTCLLVVHASHRLFWFEYGFIARRTHSQSKGMHPFAVKGDKGCCCANVLAAELYECRA